MQPVLKRLNSRVICNADDVVQYSLAYSGLRGLLVLGGRVEEAWFSNQTGTDWYASCIGLSQLQLAACDKEEGCSVWIGLLLHLRRLCATPSSGYGQGRNLIGSLALDIEKPYVFATSNVMDGFFTTVKVFRVTAPNVMLTRLF